MFWKYLQNNEQLQQVVANSHAEPQVIFKHSNRCSISQVAKTRIETGFAANPPSNFYCIDVIAQRDLSNQVANDLEVVHESPQILVIANGSCVYDDSHLSIRPADIEEELRNY